MTWDESKHPRDDIGRFTFKDGGTLKGGVEKTQGGGKFSDLFSGFNLGEIKDLLIGVITTAVPTALKVGMGVFQLKNIIEANNLEKELMKEIKIARVRKDERKNNEEETTKLTTNNRIGLSSKTTNTVNSNPKVKETAKDILYGTSQNERQQKLKDDEYKNKLLDILGDKVTQADVLYSTPKELEEKVREYGLERELEIIKNKNKTNSNSTIKLSSNTSDNLVVSKMEKPVNYKRISSPYGWRYHPIKKKNIFHNGIDLAADKNTPVIAPANGTVISAKWEGAYGNCVRIRHIMNDSKEIVTVYAHLNNFETANGNILKEGQNITKGEQIGRVGSTGKDKNGNPTSTGNHLHFEVWYNNKPQNPLDYIVY